MLKLCANATDGWAGYGYARLEKKGIGVPFPGDMGFAHGKDEAHSTIPPYATGGNLDTRHISTGSTLLVPVWVDGAVFSIGDGHVAQGDDGTTVETPMKVIARPTIVEDNRVHTTSAHVNAELGDRATVVDSGSPTNFRLPLRTASSMHGSTLYDSTKLFGCSLRLHSRMRTFLVARAWRWMAGKD
ncbi:uncharacterized protein BXZ73DRAFT_75778 [Epithele typhae]|uniref:uncharacterized protein n=1 Tax=Epithele typhae TaxID=378194 RepID=UPI002008D5DC|nr:uncharacterized protein BXZ73DRAFT_75778 [Epithele typhae]KAH9940181.1 hypothetical protein BXZ73DRAFT_75778 [Epithele typhae]